MDHIALIEPAYPARPESFFDGSQRDVIDSDGHINRIAWQATTHDVVLVLRAADQNDGRLGYEFMAR